jgi:rRNA-processing protein FCF1
MKLLMDADCLIKLTKAGLKELVVIKYSVYIPAPIKREVVDAGKKKDCVDAFAVEKNIDSKLIAVIDVPVKIENGDQALIAAYRNEDYDAIATDDVKLSYHLKALNIPFILPGLILYRLLKEGETDYQTTLWALHQLSEYISEDEYATVRLLMEKEK